MYPYVLIITGLVIERCYICYILIGINYIDESNCCSFSVTAASNCHQNDCLILKTPLCVELLPPSHNFQDWTDCSAFQMPGIGILNSDRRQQNMDNQHELMIQELVAATYSANSSKNSFCSLAAHHCNAEGIRQLSHLSSLSLRQENLKAKTSSNICYWCIVLNG